MKKSTANKIIVITTFVVAILSAILCWVIIWSSKDQIWAMFARTGSGNIDGITKIFLSVTSVISMPLFGIGAGYYTYNHLKGYFKKKYFSKRKG